LHKNIKTLKRVKIFVHLEAVTIDNDDDATAADDDDDGDDRSSDDN